MRLLLARHPQLCPPAGVPSPLAARDAALLAWLAIEGPTPRARLAQLLWPEASTEAARNSLRQRLFKLRKATGAELVSGQDLLSLAAGLSHDLDDADSVLDAAAPDDLPRGEFGAWLDLQRSRRRDRARRALVDFCDAAEAARDWDDALRHAREVLAMDPQSEESHRRLMRLHYLAGDAAAALRAFDTCERVLKDEIGARPSAETLALLSTIERGHGGIAPPAPRTLPASVLRPPRLIGRERELALLQQGWASGAVTALVGEAGQGKTRLLAEFEPPGERVARAAGRPGDAGVPFATMARLLRAAVADAAPSPTPAAASSNTEIARALPAFDAIGARPAGAGQRLAMVRAVFSLLATARVSTVVLDDLHFADEASLELLGHLLDGDDDGVAAARWLVAYRPAEAGTPLRRLHDRLIEQVRLLPVALGPLDEAALAALVDSLGLPGVDGARLAPGLMRRTGGNPLFVLETLKQAWVEEALSGLADARSLPRPVSVGRLIERRVAQLSPAALALARVASVAGEDFQIGLAEQVLGVSAMQLADALHELESAQVLRDTRFAHDLVFDAVRGSVPPAIGRHTHAQVARWLEAHDGDPARIARHWLDAGDRRAARPALRRAAEAARLIGRLREAIDFLTRAAEIELELGLHDEAFEAIERACTLENDRRDAAAASRLAARLEALARTPAQHCAAQESLAWCAFHQDRTDDARRHAQAMLDNAEARADASAAAHAHELLGLVASAQERFGEAVLHMRMALPQLENAPDRRRYLGTLNHLGMLLDQRGRPAEAAEPLGRGVIAARELGDPGAAGIVMRNAAVNRVHAGDTEGAHRLLLEARRHDLSLDAPGDAIGFTRTLLIVVSADLGRLDEAIEHGDAALAMFERADLGWIGPTRTSRASIWLHLGQWARALQELDASVQERIPSHSRARRLMLRARALAPRGQPVLDLLDEALALAPTDGRIDARLLIQLERVRQLDDAAALAVADEIEREARERGMRGFERWALLRSLAPAARLAADLPGRVRRVDALASAAHCYSQTAAEAWLARAQAARVLHDDARAQRLALEGVRWLHDTARTHVPPPIRDSFLNRHPVHRALRVLADELGAHDGATALTPHEGDPG